MKVIRLLVKTLLKQSKPIALAVMVSLTGVAVAISGVPLLSFPW